MEKNFNSINVRNICVSGVEDKKLGNQGFLTSFNISSRNAKIKNVIIFLYEDEESLKFLDNLFFKSNNLFNIFFKLSFPIFFLSISKELNLYKSF